MKKYILLYILFSLFSCSGTIRDYNTPPGYDLNHPIIYKLPEALVEISGHAFYQGNPDLIYAQQDEDGIVYTLKLSKEPVILNETTFGKEGDYEDLAILGQSVILLRSDGTLFSFPFAELKNKEASYVKKFKNLVPKGEYEGLYVDSSHQLLYILCKNCEVDKGLKQVSGYSLKMEANGNIRPDGSFNISTQKIQSLGGFKKLIFKPSALTFNPKTKEWFVLSSTNKVLVITDEQWNTKKVYHLNPKIYIQPEGIAFDKTQNLYISSEGDTTRMGRIFKISYQPKN